jgi:hypothetical protein
MKDATSQEQNEANKLNAEKSTGPKTEEGKAVSKYNAIKHGLLSEQVLMKSEDGDALLELEKKLRSELKPATEIEFLLVDKIASNFWRLKRALSFEEGEVICTQLMTGSTMGLMHDADRFFRYETMLEKGIYKALHELERIQAKRNGEKVPPPIALDIDISGEKENGFV